MIVSPKFVEVVTPNNWFEVTTGLIDLLHRGVLFAVWIDGWSVRIKRSMWSEREPLSWKRAEELILYYQEFLYERKAVCSETGHDAGTRTGRSDKESDTG